MDNCDFGAKSMHEKQQIEVLKYQELSERRQGAGFAML